MLTVYFDNGQKAEVRTAIKIEKVKEARYLQLAGGGLRHRRLQQGRQPRRRVPAQQGNRLESRG